MESSSMGFISATSRIDTEDNISLVFSNGNDPVPLAERSLTEKGYEWYHTYPVR